MTSLAVCFPHLVLFFAGTFRRVLHEFVTELRPNLCRLYYVFEVDKRTRGDNKPKVSHGCTERFSSVEGLQGAMPPLRRLLILLWAKNMSSIGYLHSGLHGLISSPA